MLRHCLARLLYAGLLAALALGFEPLHAREVEITILHTNDLHQHVERDFEDVAHVFLPNVPRP